MQTIDLSGVWALNMENAPGTLPPDRFPDSIRLPGTTSLAGLGPVNTERESGCLTELHPFIGRAWYRRSVVCGRAGSALLTLERTRYGWTGNAWARRTPCARPTGIFCPA